MRPAAAAAAAAATLLLGAGCVTSSTQTEVPVTQPTPASAAPTAGTPRQRAQIRTELAALYFGRGNFGVALEELRSAAAADPNYAPAHALFGAVYMELRENKLARASFEKALDLAPADPDINHNFGWFLCQTGEERDSLKYFMQAVRNPLYPTPWRSWSAAGLCSLKTGNTRDAEEFFQRALRLEPDDPDALLQLGQIRLRQGNLDEARRLVTRLNRMREPSAESLWLALRVERRLGERVAEQSLANQLRRRFPASPEYQALQRGQFD